MGPARRPRGRPAPVGRRPPRRAGAPARAGARPAAGARAAVPRRRGADLLLAPARPRRRVDGDPDRHGGRARRDRRRARARRPAAVRDRLAGLAAVARPPRAARARPGRGGARAWGRGGGGGAGAADPRSSEPPAFPRAVDGKIAIEEHFVTPELE